MIENLTITVDRLRIRACHGVFAQEQTVGNDFEVSVRLTYPPALQGARTDSLDSTVNYADLIAIIRNEMSVSSRLIENAAYRILGAIAERYPDMTRCDVTVTKLLLPVEGCQLAGASATVSRSLDL